MKEPNKRWRALVAQWLHWADEVPRLGGGRAGLKAPGRGLRWANEQDYEERRRAKRAAMMTGHIHADGPSRPGPWEQCEQCRQEADEIGEED